MALLKKVVVRLAGWPTDIGQGLHNFQKYKHLAFLIEMDLSLSSKGAIYDIEKRLYVFT